nr:uncharacterized protein LOC117277787 isoform X1 [Nicotiana tomentosiformis]XP_033513071.1 uncharacterized protein LOC117277787 isoform X2 [Nicotiana tomentosiformis]
MKISLVWWYASTLFQSVRIRVVGATTYQYASLLKLVWPCTTTPIANSFLVSYNPQEWPKLPEKDFRLITTPSWEDDEATPLPKNPEILMYSLVSTGYTHNFSPLEHFSKDGADHAPKIPKKNVVLSSGEKPPSSDIEATMNWQSENFISQNRILNNIDSTVKNVARTHNKMLCRVDNIEKKVE